MGFVDESKVKQESSYLKYEVGQNGNSLILKSNLYQIPFHFLKSVSRGVKCAGENCVYCKGGVPKRSEYNYMVSLNGQVGTLDVKPSVFFAIQGIAQAQRKDPRQISWTVIKTGQGLDTNYVTSKDDNLTPEAFEEAQNNLQAFNDKLQGLMTKHEQQLTENYQKYQGDIAKNVAPTPEESTKGSEEPQEQQAMPDDIPF